MDRDPPDWLVGQTYAHRGLHSLEALENSRSAVEAACAAGLGVECDVQMSRDGVPLVFHDWELDRLTGERGKVVHRDAAALCDLRLGESQDRIWTLAEFLECVAGRVPVLIEIKSLPHFDVHAASCAVAAVIRATRAPWPL